MVDTDRETDRQNRQLLHGTCLRHPEGRQNNGGKPMESNLSADAAVFVPSFLSNTPTNGSIDEQSTLDQKVGGKTKKNRTRKRRNKHKSTTKPSPNDSNLKDQRKYCQDDKKRKGRKSGRQRKRGLRKGENRWGAENNDGNYQSTPSVVFPPLTDSKPRTESSQLSMASGWSSVAMEGHRAEQAEEMRKRNEAMQIDSLSSRVELFALSNPQDPKPPPQISSVPSPPSSAEESNPQTFALSQVKNVDINRMRDRWWTLLRQKRERDALLAEQQKVEESIKTSDDDTLPYEQEHTDESDTDTDEEYPEPNEMEQYRDSSYPLHEAILAGDEPAIRGLLATQNVAELCAPVPLAMLPHRSTGKISTTERFSPLQLAVYLDKPHIVKILLLSQEPGKTKPTEGSRQTPLMLAAKMGHDACIQTLLSSGGASQSLLTRDPIKGDSALHFACRHGAPASSVRLLLNLSGGHTQKLLSCRNNAGQCALHLACEAGQNHIVEVFLQECSASVLTKVLGILDNQKQTPLLAAVTSEATDVVMTLLMWSGNHQVGRAGRSLPMDSRSNECPLVWAVAIGSIEMAHLLLEFDSGTYDLDVALQQAVRSHHHEKEELSRILIEAGANPCIHIQDTTNKDDTTSAFGTAVTLGHTPVLATLVDSYRHRQERRRTARRQDPRLQKQPPSYFRSIEEREKMELDLALGDALVRALFLGGREEPSVTAQLDAALLLFKKGVKLTEVGFTRLKRSCASKALVSLDSVQGKDRFLYEASFIHPGDDSSSTHYSRNQLKFWSEVMMKSDWAPKVKDVECSWLLAGDHHAPRNFAAMETVTLVANEGEQFVVHPALVSKKSDKLAAAIRFNAMNEPDTPSVPEIPVGISSMHCRRLLQHIYHGSVVDKFGPGRCRELLELSVIAQEFLCMSLLRECTVRLLIANPFQCFCWSCCARVREKNGTSDFECVYRARGPSRLLSPNTSLDTLAVVQQVWENTSIPLLTYSEDSAALGMTDGYGAHRLGKSIEVDGCAEVKISTIRAMLLDFPAVLRSGSFESHMKSIFSDDATSGEKEKEAQRMLLETLLHDFATTLRQS